MAEPPRRGYVLPNERTARTIGIFNVLFATGLLFCSLCYSLSFMAMPAYTQLMKTVAKQAETETEARKKSDLEKLAEDEKKATTEEQKEAIKASRAAVENRPRVDIPVMDFTKIFADTKIRAWTFTELVTGILLNTLLLISGIGLLGTKPWSRGMAVWTAALKILRLVIFYAIWCFVIVPPMSRALGEMVGGMMNQQQAAMGRGGAFMPTEVLIKTYSIIYTIGGIGMMVFGSIYPAIVIWFLTRPNVKAAFVKPERAEKPPMEPNGTW